MPSSKDTVTKAYMSNPVIFADAFNFLLYDGKQVIRHEDLKELDSASIALPYGTDGVEIPVQRFRDILKSCTIMEDGRVSYFLLGIENQADLHYAMPVRNMLYDSLQYSSQVQAIARRHRREKDHEEASSGEFLSGFYRSDRLRPVITLVVCFSPEPWEAPVSLHEMLDVENRDLLRYIPDYRINLITPSGITEEDMGKFHSELRKILLCLKYSKDKIAWKSLVQEGKLFHNMSLDAANLLNMVAGLKLRYSREKGEFDMSYAWDELLQDARNEGRSEGWSQGRNEGWSQGRSEERLNSIRNLMDSLHWTAQQAMDALKIPASEQERYLPQL